MKQNLFIYCTIFILVNVMSSCRKGWLDEKPQKSLAVPSTVAHFQALLDNTFGGQVPMNARQPGISEVVAGDFFVTDLVFNDRTLLEQNLYKWSPNPYEDVVSLGDWDNPYECIFYANVVIDGLDEIGFNSSNENAWKQAMGGAYFLRAYYHFSIAQLFCNVYSKQSANLELGIPLRLNSDFNVQSARSSIQETYEQILADLKQAQVLLPISVPHNDLYRLRPTKVAADAMLARVYLSMSDFENALLYADKALTVLDTLMDYGALRSTGGTPVFRFNPEVIFHMVPTGSAITTAARLTVDSNFYDQYSPDDLRRFYFFRNNGGRNIQYRGSYDGSSSKFSGLATDEMFLIRAECRARTGNYVDGMEDLNYLLDKRWTTGKFVPYVANNSNEALSFILQERRKELCFRCLRWTDLRRLNNEGLPTEPLKRIVKGQVYTLPPGDLKYTLLIPPNVIQLSGISQNPR